ncbi:MAG: methyltransferase, TIGR04325 family [Rubrivivax sp.]|nr:methyltransferase, TIGR04325 family [Rubrivivax sp.]
MQQGQYYPGLEKLKQLPVIRDLWQRQRLNHFLSVNGGGLHYGKFASFDEARAWLPKNPGYDLESLSDEYLEVRTRRIYAFDYPVMFWLRNAFEAGARSIFDIGGSVGVQYYSYRRYMSLPEDLVWRVSELPVVCRLGREYAQRQGVTAVQFSESLDTSTISDDIWIAAGVLEVLENARIEGLLAGAARRPQHILINKLPLWRGEEYVSAQNIGSGSFTAHYVFNRERFVAAVEAQGYKLLDSWDVPERCYQDPREPERDFANYSGLCFRRT